MRTGSASSPFPRIPMKVPSAAPARLQATRKRSRLGRVRSRFALWTRCFAAGEIPPADYIKLDCEGCEPEVIRGARNYLASSNILCVTAESNFGGSPGYLRTPFVEICEMLSEHRLLVFDVAADRSPRPSYVAARARRPWSKPDIMKERPPPQIGQLGTFDFLFCRDFVAEKATPHHFVTLPGASLSPTVDKLIKSMINFELHGLMDCALIWLNAIAPSSRSVSMWTKV